MLFGLALVVRAFLAVVLLCMLPDSVLAADPHCGITPDESVSVVEAVTLFALCYVTMLTFMPWKVSQFYTLSEGYPCMLLMKYCLGIKLIESLGSVISESLYLGRYGDTAREETKFLFAINLVFSILSVVVELLVLLTRRSLLKVAGEQEERALLRHLPPETGGVALQTMRKRGSAGVSFEDSYPEQSDIQVTCNPLQEEIHDAPADSTHEPYPEQQQQQAEEGMAPVDPAHLAIIPNPMHALAAARRASSEPEQEVSEPEQEVTKEDDDGVCRL